MDCPFCSHSEGSGLSWNGFNIFGDRKSVDEVSRLIHVESYVEVLRSRLAETERARADLQFRMSSLEK